MKTIDDIVKHAEALKTALCDQSQLHSSAEVHAARASSLRKRRQQQQQQRQACSGCGSNTHGIVGTPPRHSHCPAWGKLCDTCKKPNIFAPVCCKPTATVSSLVAHVHYDSNIDAFTSPENTEEIKAEISPQVPNSHTVTLDIFPDSGANICLAGLRHLQQMGLHPSQLRQCHKRVKAVGGSILICKGWIPATFKIEGYTTTQPLYICEKVDRLYFSRQGCLAVNILSHNYPRQCLSLLFSHFKQTVPLQCYLLRSPPSVLHLRHDRTSCLILLAVPCLNSKKCETQNRRMSQFDG